MNVQRYLRIVAKTDQLEPLNPTDPNYKTIPILGLAGEVGSLLTELKKRVREPNRKVDVGTKPIAEELGDIIWYSAAIARRAALDFEQDVLVANLRRIHSKGGGTSPASEYVSELKAETFRAYQICAAKTRTLGTDLMVVVPYLARIWHNSSQLLNRIEVTSPKFNETERQSTSETLGDVMWYVAEFATLYELDLDEIVLANSKKAESMFAPLNERVPTPLRDEGLPVLEQFPRRFDVNFISTDAETAVMLINGIRVGDPLRDNAYQLDVGKDGIIDGYRFHDCIHLAFVAVLGWSPVVRGLLKRKRKSKKLIDDAEDGARAQIVEEMIVKLAHSYAVGVDRLQLLQGRNHVSMDLLKQIQILAGGLEISTNKLWEWEKAIILGFKTFDQLRKNKNGRVRVDLRTRDVTFFPLLSGEGIDFPEPH